MRSSRRRHRTHYASMAALVYAFCIISRILIFSHLFFLFVYTEKKNNNNNMERNCRKTTTIIITCNSFLYFLSVIYPKHKRETLNKLSRSETHHIVSCTCLLFCKIYFFRMYFTCIGASLYVLLLLELNDIQTNSIQRLREYSKN